jgi:hypothetical protein
VVLDQQPPTCLVAEGVSAHFVFAYLIGTTARVGHSGRGEAHPSAGLALLHALAAMWRCGDAALYQHRVRGCGLELECSIGLQ